MQEKNSLVEEALLQMKQVEEAISENAKGILASTMKEEISQLVKESLTEADGDEDALEDVDTEIDSDEEEIDVDTDNVDLSDDEDDFSDDDMSSAMDIEPEDETPIDLTNASDEEILKVFKAMGEEDGIIVKKDGSNVHLTDNEADTEYIVKLGESKTKRKIMEDYSENEFSDDSLNDVLDALYEDSEKELDEETDEPIYEIHMDEELEEESDQESDKELDEETDEPIYEIHMDEELEEETDGESMEESWEQDESYDMEESWEQEESYDLDESYSHKKAKKSTIKPKGVGMGSPKFSYKKTTGGFNEKKKQGPKSVGTGKAKFEYKEGENMGGKNKVVTGKKMETKEAARTLGNGRAWGRNGLPKPRTAPRHLKVESLEEEVGLLRDKNEEYRKALNVFREKLNEVAIFNSNLAYATRLFTEHSTTKKEKINILRRFDNVETLKESKNLYKNIKDELSKGQTSSINESVDVKLNKTVSTGSATNLIESKTYENPQFLRIKDLMTKII